MRIVGLRTAAASCILLLCAADVSYAQTNPDIPASADAARIGRTLSQERSAPLSSSRSEQQEQDGTYIPPELETITFKLNGIDIQGVTVYPPEILERLYGGMTGRTVSVADMYRLANAITKKYRQDGYILARAFLPPQTIDGGVVRIGVVEGYVEKIILDNIPKRTPALQAVLDFYPEGSLLNINDLETFLLLLGDLPGIFATSVIEPSSNPQAAPGAIVLRIGFEDKPGGASVSFNNHGSKFIGPYQMGEHVTLQNAFWHQAETNLQAFQTAQLKELAYGSIAHSIPLPLPGMSLNLEASYSKVIPGASLEINRLKSFSRVFSAGLSQYLIRGRSSNFKISGGLEWRDTVSKVLGETLYHDRTTAFVLEGNSDFADSSGAINTVDVKMCYGLDTLGARKTGSTNLSRAEGRSNFTVLEASASRNQRIFEDFSLFTQVKGQYSPKPLLSGQEFGYGGMDTGRAYDMSEIVGDRGLSAIAEVSYRIQPRENIVIQPYFFYDAGKVWNIDDVDGEDFSASSAGAGIRTALRNGLNLDFCLAAPLTKSIEDPQWGSGKTPVFKISAEYKF